VKPKLDDEDAKLFRDAVSDVTPLHGDHQPVAPRRRPARARFARLERFASIEESLQERPGDPVVESGDVLSFRRPGVAASVLRRLRRGEYRLSAELDLHGLTVAQAKEALGAFLGAALARHAGCVRIIHGKGLRSEQRAPVLKNLVNGVLRRTSAVTAFVSARPEDGGTGAVWVLLARSPSVVIGR
jgi:DNA-nicking Smr family endonuclease